MLLGKAFTVEDNKARRNRKGEEWSIVKFYSFHSISA